MRNENVERNSILIQYPFTFMIIYSKLLIPQSSGEGLEELVSLL